jgi:hypothetical protein
LYVTAAGVVGTNANTYLYPSGTCQFPNVQLVGAAGTSRGFAYRTGVIGGVTSGRWVVAANATAETGADAGSDWEVSAKTDAGGAIDSPLYIIRAAAGLITLGGAGRPITLALTDGGLRLNGQTDGAGVGVGTLTNAHSAGNPSFWLPVSIAGAARYIPCWS